ncbi:hypothetical protein [Vibrio quintilis]|uniref:Uncharacterized protein n=1 Tax=Vibrio quintilis TaxID=1117707 RepID=A0A1M7Z1Y5_9VIBR|nr:hypothetical protein [Vibrio quintilis]SHO58968.1 hypothetical protein VQ7734_04743 [Vibrio quintilis]
MSMSLNLEIASGVTVGLLRDSLVATNYDELIENTDGFIAHLPDTNVRVHATTKLDNTAILAEGLDNLSWEVGLRAFFYVDLSKENALDDIKKIVTQIADKTTFDFVLSLHYESIYAVKKSGYLWLKENFCT